VPYLSASAVVIHYEEALYQVYAPLRASRVSHLAVLIRHRPRCGVELAMRASQTIMLVGDTASEAGYNNFNIVAEYNNAVFTYELTALEGETSTLPTLLRSRPYAALPSLSNIN